VVFYSDLHLNKPSVVVFEVKIRY